MNNIIHLKPVMDLIRCSVCGADGHLGCDHGLENYEHVLAKREAHRQASRRHREKDEQNQGSGDYHAALENIRQLTPKNPYDPQDFILMAQYAGGLAKFNGEITAKVVQVARETAARWNELVLKLEKRKSK